MAYTQTDSLGGSTGPGAESGVYSCELSVLLFQSLAAHSRDAARSDVAGGPPPFIPFAQHHKLDNTSKKGLLHMIISQL